MANQLKRMFFYDWEVAEENKSYLLPDNIVIISQQERRLWVRMISEKEYAVLDFRIRRQVLPRNSIPLHLGGGRFFSGRHFSSHETKAYIQMYEHSDECTFEQVVRKAPLPEEQRWRVALYWIASPIPQASYPIVVRNDKLVVPLHTGGEIEVSEGEIFTECPKGMDERWGNQQYRVAIQDYDAWIDFARPIVVPTT